MGHKIKNGKYIWFDNHSHHLPPQGLMDTCQPTPFNNHQPRVGSKIPAGARSGNCGCIYCSGRSLKDEKLNKFVKWETHRELYENP